MKYLVKPQREPHRKTSFLKGARENSSGSGANESKEKQYDTKKNGTGALMAGDDKSEEKKQKKSLLSIYGLMLATLFSRVLGFFRAALVSSLFGGSGTADILNSVFSIPNNLRKLLAEGALSAAFIPELSASRIRDPGGRESRGLCRALIGFQLLVLIPLITLVFFFPKTSASFFLSFQNPEKMHLARQLFRGMIFYLLPVSLSAVLTATLNVHRYFLIPALAPPLFSVAVIASLLLLTPSLGIFAMLAGILLGGLLQLLIQYPLARRLGYSLRPSFHLKTPALRRVLSRWLPIVGTASIFTLIQQAAVFWASGLADGSPSAMSNALVFWQLPIGLFFSSVTTVLYPKMAEARAREDHRALKDHLTFGVEGLLALLLPVSFLFLVYGREIIALCFQRGKFTAENTRLTASVLRAYAWGLFPVSAYNFLQRYFYIQKNFKIPLLTGAFVAVLDILLSLYLKETPLAVRGLAYANSISFSLGLFILIFHVKKELPLFSPARLRRTFLKILLLLTPGIFFFLFYQNRMNAHWNSLAPGLPEWLISLTGLALFTLITLILYSRASLPILGLFLKKKKTSS